MRIYLFLAALYGLLSVALGAFGAHALKNILTLNTLEIWKTAVQYQAIHALAIILTISLNHLFNARWLLGAALLFTLGILFFSGSLYTIALAQLPNIGIVTPIGGLLLLGGWACLMIAAIKKDN